MSLVNFVPPRVPFTEPRTGLISREWYRFLQDLFLGVNSNAVLISDDVTAPGSPEAMQAIYGATQDAGQSPPPVTTPFDGIDASPALEVMRARVTELERLVDDMRKGTVSL